MFTVDGIYSSALRKGFANTGNLNDRTYRIAGVSPPVWAAQGILRRNKMGTSFLCDRLPRLNEEWT
jgi:hypothetical protein